MCSDARSTPGPYAWPTNHRMLHAQWHHPRAVSACTWLTSWCYVVENFTSSCVLPSELVYHVTHLHWRIYMAPRDWMAMLLLRHTAIAGGVLRHSAAIIATKHSICKLYCCYMLYGSNKLHAWQYFLNYLTWRSPKIVHYCTALTYVHDEARRSHIIVQL